MPQEAKNTRTTPDRIFAVPKPLLTDFDFGTETAAVFDDMLNRSVPFYDEVQRMIGELVADFAIDGTNVYDLGCSTGATFLQLSELDRNVTFVGIDSSAAMLERADAALKQAQFERPYILREQQIDQDLVIENASVVILSLTLQFVRPLLREKVIQTIANGLNHQGCLILVEKVLASETLINRLFIKHYYEFKRRNGYSDIEISQKREALENVLIPYREEENTRLLQNAGFRAIETFFKWYNFCATVAYK
jgi:tRNA (cmo5U34)-methyltransferase